MLAQKQEMFTTTLKAAIICLRYIIVMTLTPVLCYNIDHEALLYYNCFIIIINSFLVINLSELVFIILFIAPILCHAICLYCQLVIIQLKSKHFFFFNCLIGWFSLNYFFNVVHLACFKSRYIQYKYYWIIAIW